MQVKKTKRKDSNLEMRRHFFKHVFKLYCYFLTSAFDSLSSLSTSQGVIIIAYVMRT